MQRLITITLLGLATSILSICGQRIPLLHPPVPGLPANTDPTSTSTTTPNPIPAGPLLLDNYIPPVMQALAYYIELLQYEPTHTTTLEPPFQGIEAEGGTTYTPPKTTPMAGVITTSAPWWQTTKKPTWTPPPIPSKPTTTKKPSTIWWQPSTTVITRKPTTTTKKPSTIWWQTTSTKKPSPTMTPWWQTSTTKKPGQSTSLSWQTTTSPTTITPWWQTSTTKKRGQSTSLSWQTTPPPTTITPWWQTSTTKKPGQSTSLSWQTATSPTTTTSWWQTSTTKKPEQSTTQKPWWQTTTTKKIIAKPTPYHGPGIFAPKPSPYTPYIKPPIQSPLPFNTIESTTRRDIEHTTPTNGNKQTLFPSLSEDKNFFDWFFQPKSIRIEPTIEYNLQRLDPLPAALLHDISDERYELPALLDKDNVNEFLRVYDDFFGRYRPITGKKRIPPTKPYVDFLMLYDLLKRDAKAMNLNKYEGYSEQLLRDLAEISTRSAERQLHTLMTRLLARNEVSRSDVLVRLKSIVKDLENPHTVTSMAMRLFPPLQFLS